MANVATRLLSMIYLFQSRRQWTVAELAAELSVSDRTVHRYIGMLEEMGIPLYSERGPYGGFSLLRTYKLPPLIFTPDEATVLFLGARLVEDIWGRDFHDPVTGVIAKLNNVLPDDIRQQVQHAQRNLVVMSATARDYAPFYGLMSELRKCMADSRQVLLRYHSFSRVESERMVDPYALSFRWGNWYLIGFCHLRTDTRTFRIDRIIKLLPLPSVFAMPRDFDAKAFLEKTMRWENNYQVVVRLESQVAPVIREHGDDWMQVHDHADGSVRVHFDVDNLAWAAGWVLSWGELAKALEPPELVSRVKAAAHALLKRYD